MDSTSGLRMEVPKTIISTLKKNKLNKNEIDIFILHQANLYMVNSIREELNIDKEKMNAKFIYAPDINYIERAFNASKYNKYNENLCFEFHHCVNVIVANIYYVPYVQNNTHNKEKLIQHSINLLKPFISNLEIEKAELLTPNEIEEKYHVTGGHWHHGDFEIDQMLMMRPFYGSAQYTTPIKNLYLCLVIR